MPTHDDAAPLDVRELPESVDEEFAGSDWEEGPAPPSGDPGDGRTLFDTPRSEDGSVLVVFPQEKFPAWRSQALAHIDSGDGRTYLAQVAAGPYAAGPYASGPVPQPYPTGQQGYPSTQQPRCWRRAICSPKCASQLSTMSRSLSAVARATATSS